MGPWYYTSLLLVDGRLVLLMGNKRGVGAGTPEKPPSTSAGVGLSCGTNPFPLSLPFTLRRIGSAAAAAATAAERICCSANLDLLEGVSLRSCQAVVTGRWVHVGYSSNKYLQSSMQMWGLNGFEKQRGYRTEKDGTKCTMLIEVWSNFTEKEGKHGKVD